MIPYKVGRTHVGKTAWIVIVIEASGERWTYMEDTSSLHWFKMDSNDKAFYPLEPGIEVEGWTTETIEVMMDKYGWMFIDPLSRKRRFGADEVSVLIPWPRNGQKEVIKP